MASTARTQGKSDDAKLLYAPPLRIQESNLGEHHAEIAGSRNNLDTTLDQVASTFGDTRGEHMEYSLLTGETNLSERHPDVADSFNNLAALLEQVAW